jgi:small subunit ribosomal protein S23
MSSCVQFTLSLHRHHKVPLTQAYAISTKEFAKLRGAHELATQAAEAEARAHGAIFTSDPWVSPFTLDSQVLTLMIGTNDSERTQ